MPHRSNGKHRFPVSEASSRLPTGGSESPWLARLESGLSDTHEILVDKATHFIRERPGTSLILAAAIGGLLGWLIKRRT